MIPKELWFWMP